MVAYKLVQDEERAIRELKARWEGLLGDRILKLVLFGSRAHGDHSAESDIDIAVVVRELGRDSKDRMLDAVADSERKYLISLSTRIFSEEEFNRLKKRERRIALDIEREGVPL